MNIFANLIPYPLHGTPLQYSCLENPMDGGAWKAAVPGVAKSRTWLSDFTFTFHFHALENKMAAHSSVLAWRIPGMGEPGGLLSTGSQRVGHNWSDLAAAAAAITSKWNHKIIVLLCLAYFTSINVFKVQVLLIRKGLTPPGILSTIWTLILLFLIQHSVWHTWYIFFPSV